MKLYPALGYHPGHEVLAPIYHICEKCNIPITVHCGGESVSSFENRIETNVFGEPFVVDQGSRKLNARKLNEPSNWFDVMEKFKNLKVNLAHFGGSSAWVESSAEPHKRIKDILSLMEQYDGIYSDFSFNLNDQEATRIFSNRFRSKEPEFDKIKSRTMFGTDYWVVVPQSNLISDQYYFLEMLSDFKNDLLVNNVSDFLFKTIDD